MSYFCLFFVVFFFIILTAFDLHVANLGVVWIGFELHGTGQHQRQSLGKKYFKTNYETFYDR